MVVLAVALAVLVGIALGLLGGGGSIVAVPLLVYVAGLGTKEAIATSLLVVGATSAVGIIPHARAGRVRWRTGLLFGAAGMAGAYGGGRLSHYVPEALLLAGFGVMMLATAAAMIRGRRAARPPASAPVPGPTELPVLHVLAEGAVVGAVTGLVGAGGGFLVVPALALLGGLPMPAAVGTSLVVIAMKSFAGLAGYLATVEIDWALAAAFTAAAIGGSVVGARLAGVVPQDALRKTFGWFVVTMGVFLLIQQVPLPSAGRGPAWLAAGAAAVAAVAVVAVVRRRPAALPGGPQSRWRLWRA